MLIVAALLAGVRQLGRGYLLAGAAVLYASVILGALALLVDRELPFVVRIGLTAMLFAGITLALAAFFLAGRARSTARRYRLHNYYD